MNPLLELAHEHNLKIIEDCAQAHGAEYKGQKVGAIGDVGCFSFYPGKNLGAFGDGGAIVTNINDTAERCRMIANHGRISKYNHKFEGRNSRLDGLQAAILTVKLRHLDRWTDKRIMIANEYLARLKNIPEIILPVKQDWAKQVYHLFVIRHSNRDKIQTVLKESGIQTGIHYPIALPKLEAYKELGQANERGFSWTADNSLLSLPIGEHLSIQDDLNIIINCINNG
jgi:dTDP-4-amino-4,6-dideoxygalactose transaminase